ncbi:hypothetical protein XM52_08765 [Roseovarius indicus]|uniref:Uncharacterized protein n=2 Tax=Roseovarius indicus TaxID=540747 RepID=A0A0T5PAG0_9RHOB|nr:hypothetical protein XM52_08765 [Roseovarius indicus]
MARRGLSISANFSGFDGKDTMPRHLGQQRGEQMKKLQVKYLMRLHSVTEAQAQALAFLIWGAS